MLGLRRSRGLATSATLIVSMSNVESIMKLIMMMMIKLLARRRLNHHHISDHPDDHTRSHSSPTFLLMIIEMIQQFQQQGEEVEPGAELVRRGAARWVILNHHSLCVFFQSVFLRNVPDLGARLQSFASLFIISDYLDIFF